MAFQEVGNLNCFVYSQQLLQDKTESSRGEKQHDMFAKRFDIYIYFATTLYMRCWLKLAIFVLFLHLCIFCCTAPCLSHHLVPSLLSFSCLGLCFFHYLSFCIASFIRGGSRAAATSKMECFVLGCCSSPRSASGLLSHLFLKGNICS